MVKRIVQILVHNSGNMESNKKNDYLIQGVTGILHQKIIIQEKLKQICYFLKDKVSIFNWVGIYFFDKNKNQLILGPFSGDPSPHTKIPSGNGVCGQVCKKKETLVIQDVTKETNYLSCSPLVKSEIVIPLIKNGNLIGEIDIDSHTVGAFTEKHRESLEKIAEMISEQLDP